MSDKMTKSNRLTNLIEYLRGSAKTASECSCPTFWPEGYCNVAADDDERKQFDAEVRREMQALGIIS
jgi:hypothetical protein